MNCERKGKMEKTALSAVDSFFVPADSVNERE